MAHDVFISYSSEDKLAADSLCGALEAARIRCWIAPRDVESGLSYGGEISRAIKNSRVMVLIFSEHSNVSSAVLSEVELAANARIRILNFRVDDSPLGDDLRFYLQRLQWFDALTPPMQQHHARLVQMIQRLLAQELSTTPPPPPLDVVPRKTDGWRAKKIPLLRILVPVALVAGGAGILIWIPRHCHGPITPLESSHKIQKGELLSRNRDEPTLLTSNEIRGNGVGETISYYCTFNAGPDTVTVTVDSKNKPGLLPIRPGEFSDALAVEISDLDAKRLFYVTADYSAIGNRKVARFQLARRQQVIMRILLGQFTLDYMVRIEGPGFSPATKGQGTQ